MKTLTLTVRTADGRAEPVSAPLLQALLVGYTGRDRTQVLAHVQELAALGVAPPARVPAVYVVDAGLVTTESRVAVGSSHTSGEAEFYLLPTDRGLLVGAGSDHTDRAHERIDVAAAKARCPKPISREAWPFEEVRAHWDRLELRSWVPGGTGGTGEAGERGRRLYQESRLDALLPVDTLLAALAAAGHGDLSGRIVFGGTVPVRGEVVYGQRFEVELRDPVLGRRLTCAYDVVRTGSTAADAYH